MFRRSFRLLLLRYQTQLVGTIGGRGRENRAEDEAIDEVIDETAKSESVGDGAAREHRHGAGRRQLRRGGRRPTIRTKEAHQPGADSRQKRQQPVRVTVRFPEMGRRLERLTKPHFVCFFLCYDSSVRDFNVV